MDKSASHWLKEIRIIGGFLDGVVYQFSDRLNCIIGARGTGKTSILEFIRYGLNAMPINPREQKRIENLVESNLDGGRIEITIETREGLPYIISRSFSEQPIVLDLSHKATGLNFTPSLFRLDVFSQNEVEEIAGQSMSQLALLESFSQEELTELNSHIDQTRKSLEANAAATIPLKKHASELADSINILPGLTKRLQDFASGDSKNAEKLNAAHTQKGIRDREDHYVNALYNIYKETGTRLKGMKGDIQRQMEWCGNEELQDGADYELIRQLHDELAQNNAELDTAIDAFIEKFAQSYGRFDEKRKSLAVRHQQADIEFRQLIEKCKEEQVKSAERMKVEKERNRLLASQMELGEVNRKLKALETERQGLLQRLSEFLDRRFNIRKEIVDHINAALMPNVRVSLQQFGCKEKYLSLLVEALRGAAMQYKQVAGTIAELAAPARFSALIRKGDEARLIDSIGLNPNQAKAVISMLRNDEFLSKLEIVDMPDLPKIELNDYGTYKTTETLSTGQKCNTILPILLLDSDRPLLIDQPEDNLDNGFVHRIIVDSVQRVKQNRQLVFVTHNPNIPVLSDAERMLVLESNGTAGRIRNAGTVDECKEDIVNLLEGGEAAFKKRKERYSY